MVEGHFNRGEDSLLAEDMVDVVWQFQNLSFDLPPSLKFYIKAIPLHSATLGEDKLCWVTSSNGDFDPKKCLSNSS